MKIVEPKSKKNTIECTKTTNKQQKRRKENPQLERNTDKHTLALKFWNLLHDISKSIYIYRYIGYAYKSRIFNWYFNVTIP